MTNPNPDNMPEVTTEAPVSNSADGGATGKKVRTAFTKDERGLMNNWAIEPKMYVDEGESRFGFTTYAELINGRLAMLGIVGLVIIELVTHKSLLQIMNGM
ncbi:MAG: chlorophyll a/b-binding protein [Pseudanabaenaceae cyanobacterium]